MSVLRSGASLDAGCTGWDLAEKYKHDNVIQVAVRSFKTDIEIQFVLSFGVLQCSFLRTEQY
jgi:hypothetical protein